MPHRKEGNRFLAFNITLHKLSLANNACGKARDDVLLLGCERLVLKEAVDHLRERLHRELDVLALVLAKVNRAEPIG